MVKRKIRSINNEINRQAYRLSSNPKAGIYLDENGHMRMGIMDNSVSASDKRKMASKRKAGSFTVKDFIKGDKKPRSKPSIRKSSTNTIDINKYNKVNNYFRKKTPNRIKERKEISPNFKYNSKNEEKESNIEKLKNLENKENESIELNKINIEKNEQKSNEDNIENKLTEEKKEKEIIKEIIDINENNKNESSINV